jgi:beta-phosphoglucomutase family hydrolase
VPDAPRSERLDAVIFDMDGVVTQTARLHSRAWKQLFDEYLETRRRRGESHEPFDPVQDYLAYVDGKPRYEGVRSFLEARGIEIPFGNADDGPDVESACGLGNRKDRYFERLLHEEGAEVFESTVKRLEELRTSGARIGLVTSSKHGRQVIELAHLTHLFDVIVDGNTAEERQLRGKPHPDIFVEAARALGTTPGRAAVVEDAVSGVEAARRGDFASVIAVNRGKNREPLGRAGADLVVDDLAEISADEIRASRSGPRDAHGWVLVYEGFDPERQPLREALCALGNGVLVTRGAAEEAHADGVHYPGTYLAGGYDRLETPVAGRTIVNEDLVNFPNWLPLTFRAADGDWVSLATASILEWRQELDMRRALLTRRMRVRDGDGRETSVVSRRLVHMGDPHLAAIDYQIVAENWSGHIEVRSELDGSVVNSGVARYRQLASKHLETVAMGEHGESGLWLLVRTSQSRIEMGLSACTRAWRGEERIREERRVVREPERIGTVLAFEVRQGEPVSIEKLVAIYTSRDAGVTEASLEAREAIDRCGRFEELLQSHELAWVPLWRRCDIGIEPAGQEQLILRLHIFHMLQTVCLNTIGRDVGVPARGWHGEAYRGHIFWDELFIFPLFNLRFPMITRSQLLYRYRRLPRARWLARQEGFRGAMFPWQSGSNGQEETQSIHLNPRDNSWGPDYSRRQRHVNVAIVYNVWQYYVVTGDREFLSHYGAEMIFEIARFLGSLCHFNDDRGRWEIHGVMGPDEYSEKYPDSDEPGLRNNAYTNVMAVWVMERALDVLDLLPPARVIEIAERIGLEAEEVARWRDVLEKMFVPFHGDGIISQFEGYERLKEFDWEGFRAKYGDIKRLDRILKAEGDSPDRYKMSKQADVLMLFYLLPPKDLTRIFERLGYAFSLDTQRKTVQYYLPRTAHGSTLSKIVHASVIDRIDRSAAWSLFQEGLQSDFADVQGGTTPEGIHLGAMGGTVDIVFRHYAGVDLTGDVIAFHPRLPEALRRLRLRVRHRGRWYEVTVTHDRFELEVEAAPPGPVRVKVFDEEPELKPGDHYETPLKRVTV